MRGADLTEEVGNYYFNQEEKSMSNFFALNFKDVLGAVISAGLVAALTYFIENINMFAYLVQHPILSVGVLAAAGSLLKALLTTGDGKFAGAVPIK